MALKAQKQSVCLTWATSCFRRLSRDSKHVNGFDLHAQVVKLFSLFFERKCCHWFATPSEIGLLFPFQNAESTSTKWKLWGDSNVVIIMQVNNFSENHLESNTGSTNLLKSRTLTTSFKCSTVEPSIQFLYYLVGCGGSLKVGGHVLISQSCIPLRKIDKYLYQKALKQRSVVCEYIILYNFHLIESLSM